MCVYVYVHKWEVPKIGVPFVGVPLKRILVKGQRGWGLQVFWGGIVGAPAGSRCDHPAACRRCAGAD